jgi:O-antigen biosynthesis protein WbqV
MKKIRLGRTTIAACHDAFMAALSFLLALHLRFGFDISPFSLPYFTTGMALFTTICIAVFISMRLYRGMWHFASTEDLISITKAVSLAILIFAFLMFTLSRLDGFPRSTLIINWLLLIFMLGAPRFAYRIYKDKGLNFAFKRDQKNIPLLLYGAGSAAEIFIRDSFRNDEFLYKVVGIVDDDPKRSDSTIHGIKIYSGAGILPFIIRKFERKGIKPQRLVITEEVSAETLKHMLEVADSHGLTLSRLPSMQLEKHSTTPIPFSDKLRPIDIEDLLGRPQALRDKALMNSLVSGKRVMITGAGGSIGSELCRQIAELQPSALIFYELSEYALYSIDMEIVHRYPELKRYVILGDVRNKSALHHTIQSLKPDIIFHAAAIKHVPISEENPLAAIETNICGTARVAASAAANNVPLMVTISTDKAVNPSNIMGATKRFAERVITHQPESHTRFITVRFGNVLGSRGSVVPLFQKQLQQGGPLTVTHREMTRYFMTIREAVDLVIHAAALGNQQADKMALFVLDMGEPVKIVDLARQIIRLSGLKPDEDIKIIFTGLRAGEKLYEELFYKEESPKPTAIKGVLQAANLMKNAIYSPLVLEALEKCCMERNEDEALTLLRKYVPEYTPITQK